MSIEEAISSAIEKGFEKVLAKMEERAEEIEKPRKKIMSLQEAADEIGVPRSTVYNWTHRADCDFMIKTGRTIRILPEKLYKWIDRTACGEIPADCENIRWQR